MLMTFILTMGVPSNAGTLIPRTTFEKSKVMSIKSTERWDFLVVKFVEGSDIRFRDGMFVSKAAVDLTPLHDVLSAYPETKIARLFHRSESDYELEKVSGEAVTGRELADLNLYYAIQPRSVEQSLELLNHLNALKLVECIYPEPIPRIASGPLPDIFPVPDYVDSQDYLESSPVGVDAYASWTQPGGRGENVQMIDVELGWNWSHVDIPEPFYIGGTPDPTDTDHGTAVMGEIAGIENSFGITGISPAVSVGGVAIDVSAWPENVAAWFDMASDALEPGDVWLIELHGPGPDGNYVPMEWWQANYDAIANSTAQGRICVEAGGNGSANLDSPIYQGKFDRNIRDSLAIMVGAGTPYNMQPEWFTNYGSRVDVNGWGSEIVTTGYGDLYSSEGLNSLYTAQFGGTSGASPMVVGVCCNAQSIYKELTGGYHVLDPVSLRTALVETGAPQPQPVTQHIGPRPNFRALLDHPIFDVSGVFFDQSEFNCSDTVHLTVNDDMAGTQTIPVTVISTTDSVGETVIMNQINPGWYEGTFQTSSDPPIAGDGIIAVQSDDTLQVFYAPLSSTDEARIDCVGPVIQNVTVSEISDSYVRISWQTDEETIGTVYYGMSQPDQPSASSDYGTDQTVLIENLLDCSHYYFTIESSDVAGNITVDDHGGNFYSFVTRQRVLALDATMETNPGWSVQGEWAWGIPTGQGGEYGEPDPASGYTGTHVYGYNLAGDYANNMSSTMYLTTPAIDCSELSQVGFQFWGWLGVEMVQYDHARIEISNNDGGTWSTIWTNSGTLNGGIWELWSFDISSVASGYSNVKIRWGMGPTDSSWRYCGWNIDDVQVFAMMDCQPTPTPTPACMHTGDVNMNGQVTSGDAQLAFSIVLGVMTPTESERCAADCDGNQAVSAGDAQRIFGQVLGIGSCVDPI